MKNCPNCGEPVTPQHVAAEVESGGICLLSALLGVVNSRGNTTPPQIKELMVFCDTDSLWIDLGKVIDRLEAGEYSSGE